MRDFKASNPPLSPESGPCRQHSLPDSSSNPTTLPLRNPLHPKVRSLPRCRARLWFHHQSIRCKAHNSARLIIPLRSTLRMATTIRQRWASPLRCRFTTDLILGSRKFRVRRRVHHYTKLLGSDRILIRKTIQVISKGPGSRTAIAKPSSSALSLHDHPHCLPYNLRSRLFLSCVALNMTFMSDLLQLRGHITTNLYPYCL